MDNDYKVFFGDSEKSTPKKEMTTKDWSSDWLKMKEQNLLAQGSSISSPYSQSYIVYRAIRSIAENIPQAKYKIIDLSTEKPVPLDSPISKLFLNPNPFMSRFEFWEAIGSYLNLNGEAFVYINESLGGISGFGTAPAEMWVLNPSLIAHALDDGQIAGWSYNNAMPIDTKNMIHFKLFNPDSFSIRGQSPLNPSKFELEADYSASKWNKIFYDNNATPDGVIEVDKDKQMDLADLRKLKNMWYENHGGVDRSHKTAFLMGGMTYKAMGISQKDMDFLQGRQFSRDSILSVFGVHPFVAGFYDSGTVTRATAKEAKRLFWTGTLKPQLIRIEEKLATAFFPRFAPGFTGKFDYSEVEELQEDYDSSVTTAKELFSIGYTRNEVNKRMQLNMPEEGDGDVRYLPMNLIPQDEDGPEDMGSETVEPEKGLKNDNLSIKQMISDKSYQSRFIHLQKAMEKILHSKLKRFLFGQRKEVLSLLNSYKELTPEKAELLAKLGGIYNESDEKLVKLVTPVFNEAVETSGEMALETLGLKKPFIVPVPIIDNRLNMIKGINTTVYDSVKRQVFEGIKEGESITKLAERVKSIYNTTSNKARVIARTETSSLMNGTTNDVYKSEGVSSKMWVSEPDARDSHQINGEVRAMGQLFSNGLEYPGDPNGSPENVINCRCTIAPVISDT